MKYFCALMLLLVTCVTVLADDLDLLVSVDTTPQKRSELYESLLKADFAVIGPKLAKLLGEHPVLGGIVPGSHPWTEQKLSPKDRIGCTLIQLWTEHVKMQAVNWEHFDIFLKILEDTSVGNGRYQALSVIATRLHWGSYHHDKNMPPLDGILSRLDRLLKSESTPDSLRRGILPILFEHSDPNRYLELAIELVNKEGTPLARAEAFRFSTPPGNLDKYTTENRARYLNYAFGLLEQIDDGKSGDGYFLALHLGTCVGVKPIRNWVGPFAPDSRLPEFKGEHGLKPEFFQQTVDHAREWWKEHKHACQN